MMAIPVIILMIVTHLISTSKIKTTKMKRKIKIFSTVTVTVIVVKQHQKKTKKTKFQKIISWVGIGWGHFINLLPSNWWLKWQVKEK